jgi:hypothetical protein
MNKDIIIYKIDYEEKKDLYEKLRKDEEEEKKNAGKRKKK